MMVNPITRLVTLLFRRHDCSKHGHKLFVVKRSRYYRPTGRIYYPLAKDREQRSVCSKCDHKTEWEVIRTNEYSSASMSNDFWDELALEGEVIKND